MEDGFELLDEFQKKDTLAELKLCSVLMEDKELPWILLVPRRKNVVQINQLSHEDQMQLMKEITFSSNILDRLFKCDRLNIAAIGNKSPQLHIHIVCRTLDDAFWPETVWGRNMNTLSVKEKTARASMIGGEFCATAGDLK